MSSMDFEAEVEAAFRSLSWADPPPNYAPLPSVASSHAAKNVLLSELAVLCVDLSEAAVKHFASSTPSTPQAASTARLSSAHSISIEVALDLRYEASRLKEWASHAKQHDVVIIGSSEDTKIVLRESQIGRIVASLLDQADQFRLLLPETQRETPKLNEFQMALRTACATDSQTYASVMSARLSETPGPGSVNEIVDVLSEMNDRLWSFNTALELRSTLGASQRLAVVPPKPKATTSVITLKENTEIQPEYSRVNAEAVEGAQGEKKDSDWRFDAMSARKRYAPMQHRDEPMLVPEYAPRKSFSKRIPDSTVTFCEPPPPYTFEYSQPSLGFERVKAVIVGNGACGKTCALISWSKGTFPQVYVPTVFDNYVADACVGTVGGVNRIPAHVEVALWDTAGQEDYDRLRSLSYPDADVLILSYEIGFPDSLDNAIHKYYPEVKHFLPDVPIVLAGLKTDERTSLRTIEELQKCSQKPVAYEEGLTVAQELGAVCYAECSAMKGAGLEDVFSTAARVGWHYKGVRGRESKEKKCVVM